MKLKRAVLYISVIFLPFLIASCTSPPNLPITQGHLTGTNMATTTMKPTATVTIINDSFIPENVTIHVGQAVKWVWNDNSYTHNVTFPNGVSSPDKINGTWTLLFKKPGIYHYKDTLHFKVFGTVTVLSSN